MFRLEEYLGNIISALKTTFSKKLLYVGLQGSYLRGEETQDSDIDIMVVLEDITVSDLDSYRNILISMGDYDKSCGFICGKTELHNWNPLEICQLLYTTKDYYGNLKDLVPTYTRQDEINYVKESLSNLYHEICHRYIHSDRDNNIRKLPLTYKLTFFIIQNMYYLESGSFILTKRELLECIADEDKVILETAMRLKALKGSTAYEFDDTFNLLFTWCQKALARCELFASAIVQKSDAALILR